MSSQRQRRWIFAGAMCRWFSFLTESAHLPAYPAAQLAGQRWMFATALLLFLAWLPAAEVTEKQWKKAWTKPATIVKNGISENGDIGPVRFLAWPKGIPENQPTRWAKQKKLLGISEAALIKRLGKPLRVFRDCDEGRFLVYPDGIVLLQYDDEKKRYRVVGWTPRASKYEDYLVQWGC